MEYNDIKVHRGADCGTHHFTRAKIFFPLIILHGRKTSHAATSQIRIIKFNLQSLNNESTVFLYKRQLNLKLGNVTYSNMYYDIIKCSQEAAKEASGEFPENNNKHRNW